MLSVQKPAREGRPGGNGYALPREFDRITLPAELLPKQIIPLGPDVVLITNAEGRLFYWHKSRGMTPLRLHHPDWIDDKSLHVVHGANGWLAVFVSGHLNMWKVTAGGFLHKYEGTGVPEIGLEVTAVEPTTAVSTLNGRYLFALARVHEKTKTLMAWEYPQVVRDGFYA
jgi:hypothetical protein